MDAVVEEELSDPWEGVLIEPASGSTVGIVVLAGSSGRIEYERARLFARHGVTALSIRWFGGAGQPPGICEVPLETFTAAIDLLRARSVERVGILGVSKGAEAALLTAVRDPRVDVVVALSPTQLVWGNVGPGYDGEQRPYRSSWTWQGQPLPFVPYDDTWEPEPQDDGPVAIRSSYELSERTFAHLTAAAETPVEKIGADLLMLAGADDEMWPSLPFAERLAARRRTAGGTALVFSQDPAGHRPRFPGSRLTLTAFVLIGAPWSEHMIRRRPPQRPANAQVNGLVRGPFRHRTSAMSTAGEDVSQQAGRDSMRPPCLARIAGGAHARRQAAPARARAQRPRSASAEDRAGSQVIQEPTQGGDRRPLQGVPFAQADTRAARQDAHRAGPRVLPCQVRHS